MQNPEETSIKTGIIALIGPPNVGKSTLLNCLLGQKISIVSPKPQTTRNRIMGIVNGPDYQLILLDTPGLHSARTPLNQGMVKVALDTLPEVDAILFMIDASMAKTRDEAAPFQHLRKANKPVLLAVNKIDLVDKKKLLPVLNAYQEMYPFTALIPISAKSKDGIDTLLAEILKLMPEGPRLYPEDIPTDATERFIVGEIIREKIFRRTNQEVPYATAVVIDAFIEDEVKGATTIHATILVEKDSQKGIIIGKGGIMLKEIGKAARREIQDLLGMPVMLKLWVKVQKNWSTNPRFLTELGL
ncbi:MAG: GTPase Era [Desulfobulbaceae bacterium]|nr:GTPase Era [Desulfobulbaceae bacterium]